jgi:BTB/POZ domain
MSSRSSSSTSTSTTSSLAQIREAAVLASYMIPEVVHVDASYMEGDETPPESRLIASTLVMDLHSHLYDEEISDVVLIGTDGRQVVAIRSLLAMRSRFFKKLLFGSFKESGEENVLLGYSSLVLKAVVEYCYTDEIKTTFENLSFEETARIMVGLVAAGNYFELGGLMQRSYRLTCLMMDEYPALACAVLDESVSGDNCHTEELSRVALGIIRLRTESALLPPDTYGLGVQSLGEAAMERVMTDHQIQANELVLFRCLKRWAERGGDRQAAAQRLATNIDFCKVAPSDLATIVAESELVTTEVLLTAYRSQALQAERKGMQFSQKRTLQESIHGNVMVQGAGLRELNGIYTSDSRARYWQHPQYARKGVLPGYGAGEFSLHTVTMDDGTKKWFLSFQEKGGIALDLYSAMGDETDPPPMQKWLPVLSMHEKLRQITSRNKLLQQEKAHSFGASSHESSSMWNDSPPICIWLPQDEQSTSNEVN